MPESPIVELDQQFESIVCGFLNKISDNKLLFVLLSEHMMYEVYEDQFAWKVRSKEINKLHMNYI